MKKWLLWIGCILAAIGVIAVVWWQWSIGIYAQRAQAYAAALKTLLPEPQGALPEERKDNTMPVFSLEGTDFVGILEMPRYDSALPVCAERGRTFRYPCLDSGSVYDRTIRIGATSQQGQYDFYREISVGDRLFFTDMTGSRYAYTVKDIRYINKADDAQKADLTLCIRNVYGFDYILILCDAAA